MNTAVDNVVDIKVMPEPTLDLAPAVTCPAQAKDLVALHAAATIVPDASVMQRERIRSSWNAALVVIWERHDDWAVAYLPGHGFDDNETFAVHKSTGRVLGTCAETRQEHRESTAAWLERLGSH